jgi:tetratricopeptide (TPR) repeat protein
MAGMRTTTALLLAALTATAVPVAADSTFTLGVNPDLVAGSEALLLGRFEEGIALTQTGLGAFVTPDQRASALNNLCAGYTGLRRYDIAIVHCSESLKLDPGSWHAYNNRALAYLGKGLVKLARRDVRRGLRLNPGAERLLKVQGMVEAAALRHAGEAERDPIA